MTLEQVNAPTLDDVKLTEIVERADEKEIRALIEKQDMIRERVWAEESLDERWEASASFIEERAKLNDELIAFIKDTNNSTEDRVARLKEKLWNWNSDWWILDDAQGELRKFAKKTITEQAEKVPFWKLLLWIFNSYDENSDEKPWYGKMVSSILWNDWKTAIASVFWFFGLKGVANYLNGDYSDFNMSETEVPNVDIPSVEWVAPEVAGEWDNDEWEVVGVDGETSDKVELTEKQIETNQKIYSTAALLLLKQTSGINFQNNDLQHQLFDATSDQPFWTLVDAYLLYTQSEENSDRFNILKKTIWIQNDSFFNDENDVVNLLQSMVWVNARLIIEWRLDNIDSIVKEDNFIKQFGSFDSKPLEEISYHDVSILLAYTTPNVLGFIWSQSLEGLKNVYFWATESMWEFMKIMSEKRENKLSQSLLAKLASDGRTTSFWGKEYIPAEQNERYKYDVWYKLFEPEEKQQLDEVIDFKDNVIQNILTDELISWYGGFEELFNEGINYSEIISMYLLLDGNSDISQLDITSKIGLYTILSNVIQIEWNNDKFLSYIATNALNSLENEWWYFSDEESYFILSNLNKYSKWVLASAFSTPDKLRNSLVWIVQEQVPWVDISDYEWWLITIVTLWPVAAARIPAAWLWVKLAAMWASWLWVSMALWKLNESGILQDIADKEILLETREKMNKALSITPYKSIENYIATHPVS